MCLSTVRWTTLIGCAVSIWRVASDFVGKAIKLTLIDITATNGGIASVARLTTEETGLKHARRIDAFGSCSCQVTGSNLSFERLA